MDNTIAGKTKRCPTCCTANTVTAIFCSNCGLPIGNQVDLIADGQPATSDQLRREEGKGPRSLISLIGLWITLGVISAGILIVLYYSYQDLHFLITIILIGSLTLVVLNLYKATKSYLNTRN